MKEMRNSKEAREFIASPSIFINRVCIKAQSRQDFRKERMFTVKGEEHENPNAVPHGIRN